MTIFSGKFLRLKGYYYYYLKFETNGQLRLKNDSERHWPSAVCVVVLRNLNFKKPNFSSFHTQ